MAITSRRIKIDLALLSIAFLLNMTAFMSLEGLQSSLNAQAGTTSLTVAYCALVVTSLFLPAIAIDFLQARRATSLALLCYMVYSLANCYPRPYTLIPGALFMGAGSSVLWSAGRVSISDMANAYAKLESLDKNKTTASFFGTFMGVVCFCFLIGNAVTSVVLQSADVTEAVSDRNNSYTNELATLTTTQTVTILYQKEEEGSQMRCGMHNCEEANYNSTSLSPQDAQTSTNTIALSILFAGFALVQFIAACILFCAMNDIPREADDEVATNRDVNDQLTEETSPLRETNGNSEKTITEEVTPNITRMEDDGKEHLPLAKKEQKNDPNKVLTTKQRIAQQALATGKFMVQNSSGMMLIPITIHVGLFQGFALGLFTKHWVTCVLGLRYIGYAMSVFGIGAIIGSYGSGLLTQFVGRKVVLGATFLVELAAGVILFIWEPEKNDDLWIFFTLFGLFGALHALTKTVTPTLYSLFFPAEKEAANSAACIWDALGAAIAYAMGGHICNSAFVIILLALSGVGTLLYFVTESRHAKSKRTNRMRKNSTSERFTLVENNEGRVGTGTKYPEQ